MRSTNDTVEQKSKARDQQHTIPEYADNILIDACGPIVDRPQLIRDLLFKPPAVGSMKGVPIHIRRHMMSPLMKLHIPTIQEVQLAEAVHLMIRRGYIHRRPTDPATWASLYGAVTQRNPKMSLPDAALVPGISGAGKTRAVEQILGLIPQVARHTRFPGMASPLDQLLWIKVDAPSSGRASDLGANLMRALSQALDGVSLPTADASSGNPSRILDQWTKLARAHFLGLLVIDEIQNLFKLSTIKTRRSRLTSAGHVELRIVEDQTLKFLLNLTNTPSIPLILCGTHDGMQAIEKRFSTLQRVTRSGVHEMPFSESSTDPYFANALVPTLCGYQWFDQKLPPSDELRNLLHELSAGVPRIYMYLWEKAHVCAFDREAAGLGFEDFRRAMDTYMAPLKPAVAALMSSDSRRLGRYEEFACGWRSISLT